MGTVQDIRAKAFEILEKSENGIRYTELIQKIHEALPKSNTNTIGGCIWDLTQQNRDKIYNPARGVYKLVKYRSSEENISVLETGKSVKKVGEEAFYEPFRKWFIAGLGDCDNAVVLGGARNKIKWSNPDVLGTRKPELGAIINFQPEIVSVEIKTTTSDQDLITGFGQACAYKLFSHKSYLVIPGDANPDIIDRLDSMCGIFGIGFILFDANDVNNPSWQVRARAIRNEPDMYFVNEFLKDLPKEYTKELLR